MQVKSSATIRKQDAITMDDVVTQIPLMTGPLLLPHKNGYSLFTETQAQQVKTAISNATEETALLWLTPLPASQTLQ